MILLGISEHLLSNDLGPPGTKHQAMILPNVDQGLPCHMPSLGYSVFTDPIVGHHGIDITDHMSLSHTDFDMEK